MEAVAAVDPYELLEAVEILSKLPKDFYEKIVRSPALLPRCMLGAPDQTCGVCAGGQEVAGEERSPGGCGSSGQEPQTGGRRLRRPGQGSEKGNVAQLLDPLRGQRSEVTRNHPHLSHRWWEKTPT